MIDGGVIIVDSGHNSMVLTVFTDDWMREIRSVCGLNKNIINRVLRDWINEGFVTLKECE